MSHDWRTVAPASWRVADSCLKQRFPTRRRHGKLIEVVTYSDRSSGAGWAGTFAVTTRGQDIAAAYYYSSHRVAVAHERGMGRETRVLYFSNVAVEVYERGAPLRRDHGATAWDYAAVRTCFARATASGLLPHFRELSRPLPSGEERWTVSSG